MIAHPRSDFEPFSVALARARDSWQHAAAAKLHLLLRTGQLRAWIFEDGEIQEVGVEFWDTLEGRSLVEATSDEILARLDLPVFLKVDLERLIPNASGRQAQSEAEPRTRADKDETSVSPAAEGIVVSKRRTGRPPKEGHDEFWIEVCRLIHLGEQGTRGTSQATFRRAMAAWCDAYMPGAYSEESIKKKIQKVWRALDLGN
jgi:hypothetical protein